MRAILSRFVAVPAVLAVSAGSAFAALPADVTTALETAKTDASGAATVVLTIMVALFAFMLIRKAIK